MQELKFAIAMMVNVSPVLFGLGLAVWGLRRWKRGRRWGKRLTLLPIAVLCVVPLSGYLLHTSRDQALRAFLITPEPQSVAPGRVLAISMFGGSCNNLCYFLESTGLARDVVVTSADDFGWEPTAEDTVFDFATAQLFRGSAAGDGINYQLDPLAKSENDRIDYVYLTAPLSRLALIDPENWEEMAALALRHGRGSVLFDVSGETSFDFLSSKPIIRRAGGESTYRALPVFFFGERSDFLPKGLNPRVVLETAVQRGN